jgi:hypothetical protein
VRVTGHARKSDTGILDYPSNPGTKPESAIGPSHRSDRPPRDVGAPANRSLVQHLIRPNAQMASMIETRAPLEDSSRARADARSIGKLRHTLMLFPLYSPIHGTPWCIASKQLIINDINWRKPVGVEPTCDTKCRTLVLKTRPCTGKDWLPRGSIASKAARADRHQGQCQANHHYHRRPSHQVIERRIYPLVHHPLFVYQQDHEDQYERQ